MSLFGRFRSGSNSTATSTKSSAPSIDYGPSTNEPILTPPTEYEPVLNAPLDEEKEQKIKDLLAYMDTIMLDKEDPYYPNEKGFLSEATAHRYMRARKWEFEVNFFFYIVSYHRNTQHACFLFFDRQLRQCLKIP